MDRVEDVTSPQDINADAKCDRDITFYGYVRGTHLKQGTKVHLVGAGDYTMTSITALEDPCPLPNQKERYLHFFCIWCLLVLNLFDAIIQCHHSSHIIV